MNPSLFKFKRATSNAKTSPQTPTQSPGPRRAAAALLCLALAQPALAGPGAHGPNGEHLDGPAALPAASLPRVEAATEAFELVAELRAGELVILVDRFESNEPVLGARLELEAGALKAVAAYRAEQGDYVVKDPAFIQALAAPGEHSLVFTLVAGQDSELLDATWRSAAGPGQALPERSLVQRLEGAGGVAAGLGLLVTVALLGGIAWWRQRRRQGSHSHTSSQGARR